MDHSEKIEKKNPRESANVLSQLFFLWSIPTILRVSFVFVFFIRQWEKDKNEIIKDMKLQPLFPSYFILFNKLQGAFHGLDWKDLTKCLPSDNSKDLGEKLEM